jgi:hypothetical protein
LARRTQRSGGRWDIVRRGGRAIEPRGWCDAGALTCGGVIRTNLISINWSSVSIARMF